MPEQPSQAVSVRAWLLSQSGSQVGFRYLLAADTTRVGRALDNDLVIHGPEAGSVSLHHFEIHREGTGFRIHDSGSTNGTFLNGERVEHAALTPPATIRLGTQGPELLFVIEEGEPDPAKLDSTQVISQDAIPPVPAAGTPGAGGATAAADTPPGTYDGLLTEAVERARQARAYGVSGETMTIMRDALHRALRHTGRRTRLVMITLVAGLVAVTGFSAWRFEQFRKQARGYDARIRDIEAQLAKATTTPAQTDELISQLDTYEEAAERLHNSFLYRVGPHEHDFVTEEIRTIMAEFGSEVYSVPPEFTERVKFYIEQYQGPDRPLVATVLHGGAAEVRVMRRVLEEQQLPPDLAYVPLVESALSTQQSAAGAAGPWQFTAPTAKMLGLRVDREVDERMNVLKSTQAACRYLRNLILDFGSGSSVMLALAAYNLGPTKVKQAVMRTVHDPIKQRNFWYLYRARALPAETREYVPKVIAAMIIGRNAKKLGF